ncbi:hypothetical protein [Salinicoccus halitifaciens]|uniref:EF-hand domain-containing protein n=1 Tax=Salinicoccus halitifaciens TaxID=1073415 RepID=A0ABV2E607_9STAP|nr:hypothetical protein [Salinicoccus halitifaciens]MCD2137073.1 hypothetical protein [Salinicoccus halitifaciens]
MEVLSELFGPAGLAGALGATLVFIGKTLFKSFISRSDKRVSEKIELQSYKQKALFDSRFEVYSDIYAKMKELEGTIKSFENPEWLATTKIEEAFHSKDNLQFFENLSDEEFKQVKMAYDVNSDRRCTVNFNHFINLMLERKIDLNNYVSNRERLLSDDEGKLFADLIRKSESLIDKIDHSYYKAVSNGENDCYKIYTGLEKELSHYFENDLKEINNIIREIDNKFREEIYS